MDVDRTARVSFGAKLDKTNPQGIHIGKNSYIASGALLFLVMILQGIYIHTHILEINVLLELMRLLCVV